MFEYEYFQVKFKFIFPQTVYLELFGLLDNSMSTVNNVKDFCDRVDEIQNKPISVNYIY